MSKEKPALKGATKNAFQGLLTDVFELPKDLILNLPRVTMVGNIQLTLENHRGVIEYSASRVCVAVAKGELIVKGQRLQIRSIVAEEIVIDGLISEVAYAN